MKIISRAEWGARPFKRVRRRVSIKSRRYFVVHYPGAGTPPRDVKAYAKWIERIHMNERGWAGVGYNFLISQGQIAEGCGRDIVGSHSPPHNVNGLGVNVWTSRGVPMPEDLAACRALYEEMCKESGRRLKMWYHGKDYATSCPGRMLKQWVEAGMPWPDGYGPNGSTEKPSTKPTGSEQTIEDDDMAMSPQERQKLIDDIAKAVSDKVWWTPLLDGKPGELGSTKLNNFALVAYRVNLINTKLNNIINSLKGNAK